MPTKQQKAQKKLTQQSNVRPINKQKGREMLKEHLQSNQKRKKTCTTGKRAGNKQAKLHGKHKGVSTEKPKAQKHAQTANV